METSGPDLKIMSDSAIAEHIAAYLKNARLEQNKTQAELAQEAGLTRRTVSSIETGTKTNISILTLIQLLRALNCLHVLNNFKITNQISPLELARIEQEKRKRASSDKKTTIKKNKSDW